MKKEDFTRKQCKNEFMVRTFVKNVALAGNIVYNQKDLIAV
jgi:hypothetical protein